jgi:serine phosphatase RsbU (regulator of sigma subunit)
MQLSNETVSRLRSAIADGVREGARQSATRTDWRHKFDMLIAAVFSEDDTIRDRILARAKELEAESDEHDDQ